MLAPLREPVSALYRPSNATRRATRSVTSNMRLKLSNSAMTCAPSVGVEILQGKQRGNTPRKPNPKNTDLCRRHQPLLSPQDGPNRSRGPMMTRKGSLLEEDLCNNALSDTPKPEQFMTKKSLPSINFPHVPFRSMRVGRS